MNIKQELIGLSDEKYAKFIKKIAPDTKHEIIGIRLPQLREVAKTIIKKPSFNLDIFLNKMQSDRKNANRRK